MKQPLSLELLHIPLLLVWTLRYKEVAVMQSLSSTLRDVRVVHTTTTELTTGFKTDRPTLNGALNM